LTAHTHHEQVRADRRIGYDSLFSGRVDDDGDGAEIPGQLSITDIIDRNGTSA
jgi:putative transposase